MSNPSPFFVGYHRRLFGRNPFSVVRICLDQTAIADQLCGQQPVALFGQFIEAKLLDFKATSGTNSRSRILSLPVTFWAFPGQVLDSGSSCRNVIET